MIQNSLRVKLDIVQNIYEKDKNKEIRQMGSWISDQQQIYKKKERIMKIEEIYDIWTEFINDDNYL